MLHFNSVFCSSYQEHLTCVRCSPLNMVQRHLPETRRLYTEGPLTQDRIIYHRTMTVVQEKVPKIKSTC